MPVENQSMILAYHGASSIIETIIYIVVNVGKVLA